jgi:hypothetical protein
MRLRNAVELLQQFAIDRGVIGGGVACGCILIACTTSPGAPALSAFSDSIPFQPAEQHFRVLSRQRAGLFALLASSTPHGC